MPGHQITIRQTQTQITILCLSYCAWCRNIRSLIIPQLIRMSERVWQGVAPSTQPHLWWKPHFVKKGTSQSIPLRSNSIIRSVSHGNMIMYVMSYVMFMFQAQRVFLSRCGTGARSEAMYSGILPHGQGVEARLWLHQKLVCWLRTQVRSSLL